MGARSRAMLGLHKGYVRALSGLVGARARAQAQG
jgi:hypothetical protein